MEKEMEMGKNIMKMVQNYLKVNIKMEKELIKEKNIMLVEN